MPHRKDVIQTSSKVIAGAVRPRYACLVRATQTEKG
jgi:hypothetical protein